MRLFSLQVPPPRYLALVIVVLICGLNTLILYQRELFVEKSPERLATPNDLGKAPFNGAMYEVAMAFGDSITQYGFNPETSGWLTHLSNTYERRLDILNRGFNKLTTKVARIVAEEILPITSYPEPGILQNVIAKVESAILNRLQWPPRDTTFPLRDNGLRLLIIFFGSNDSVLDGFKQHVPLPLFFENLHYIVSLLREPDSKYYSPETRIVLVTPPPLGDKMWKETMQRAGKFVDRKNEHTRLYADVVRRVALDLKIPCVDLWGTIEGLVREFEDKLPILNAVSNGAFGSSKKQMKGNITRALNSRVGVSSPYDGYERYLSDGLHLNSNGNKLLADLVTRVIISVWPDMNPFV